MNSEVNSKVIPLRKTDQGKEARMHTEEERRGILI